MPLKGLRALARGCFGKTGPLSASGSGQGWPGPALHLSLRHLPQLEGAFPDTMTKCAELLNRTIDVDFVDINVGCPIDLVYKKVVAAGPQTPVVWVGRKPGTWPCSLPSVWGPAGVSRPLVQLRQRRASGAACVPHSLAPAACFSQGGGCALMNRSAKFQQIVRGMNQVRALTSLPCLRPPTPSGAR